jgi:hypothetical protein
MRTNHLRLLVVALLVGLCGVLPPVQAQAGLDVDLGATLKVGDDTDVFLSVSARYFDRERRDVEQWHGKCVDPDDLAVLLFISRSTGKSPARVMQLRLEGQPWWEIGRRLGMGADVWFVPVRRDPGPPYGKAYGHWRKHGKDSHHELDLSDDDVRNLVAVRLLHEYFDVEVEVAMEWRSSGKDLRSLAAGKYQERHGHAKSASAPGKSKKSGKGGKRK